MNRQQVQPVDIRKGDLIRWEKDPANRGLCAVEFSAGSDGYRYSNTGQHYLLARAPKPPLELPDKPTLGWIDAVGEKSLAVVGVKLPSYATPDPIYIRIDAGGHRWDRINRITAFTPAIAVPKAALDELRSLHKEDGQKSDAAGMTPYEWWQAAGRFLDAIDTANDDT